MPRGDEAQKSELTVGRVEVRRPRPRQPSPARLSTAQPSPAQPTCRPQKPSGPRAGAAACVGYQYDAHSSRAAGACGACLGRLLRLRLQECRRLGDDLARPGASRRPVERRMVHARFAILADADRLWMAIQLAPSTAHARVHMRNGCVESAWSGQKEWRPLVARAHGESFVGCDLESDRFVRGSMADASLRSPCVLAQAVARATMRAIQSQGHSTFELRLLGQSS